MAIIATQSILAFLSILLIVSTPFIEAREMPDVKHPDSFINSDRSFLIPGIGRVMVPDHKEGFNPFTYNPVTGNSGTNSGTGVSVPGIVGGGTGRSYVPGGDDTYVPNPGVEVPATNPGVEVPATNPGSGTTGGIVPVPSAARP